MAARIYNCDRHVDTNGITRIGNPYLQSNLVSTSADLREYCSPVYDQGQLGACTGFASAKGLLEILLRKKTELSTPIGVKPRGSAPSMAALYVYYYERVAEKTVGQDAGAQIVDAMWVLKSRGCATELNDPYVIETFTQKPADAAEAEAPHYKLSQAFHLHGLDDMRNCLASGYPFIGGIDIFDSFESEAVAMNGVVPMPKPGESLLGGHAVCFVGYDNAKQAFLVRNSWGPNWGEQGYFWLPYQYALSYGSDYWTGRL